MKLHKQQLAPTFQTIDVFGNPVSLAQFKGKKIYLAFMRFAGCPVCNLRVHTLLKQGNAFKEKNIEVVLIYESSIENMLVYLNDETYPFTFVADPQNSLYNAFGVETSFGKLLKSLFKGMLDKVKKGEKLFKKKPVLDGKVTRMEAEFLIDKNGKLLIAHYGSFLGDNVAIDEILKA
jgi:thioredoxin-dependent peroxiredoxin